MKFMITKLLKIWIDIDLEVFEVEIKPWRKNLQKLCLYKFS